MDIEEQVELARKKNQKKNDGDKDEMIEKKKKEASRQALFWSFYKSINFGEEWLLDDGSDSLNIIKYPKEDDYTFQGLGIKVSEERRERFSADTLAIEFTKEIPDNPYVIRLRRILESPKRSLTLSVSLLV